jgi:hypothetical protein
MVDGASMLMSVAAILFAIWSLLKTNKNTRALEAYKDALNRETAMRTRMFETFFPERYQAVKELLQLFFKLPGAIRRVMAVDVYNSNTFDEFHQKHNEYADLHNEIVQRYQANIHLFDSALRRQISAFLNAGSAWMAWALAQPQVHSGPDELPEPPEQNVKVLEEQFMEQFRLVTDTFQTLIGIREPEPDPKSITVRKLDAN